MWRTAARPAAHIAGVCENVWACLNARLPRAIGAITRSEASTADSGTYPPDRPLPMVMMSGVTPKCSTAAQVPVRPAPVRTSSHTSSTSWRSQISRMRCQYPAGGTEPPVDEPPIGSAMKAATLSGPSARIARSSASPVIAGSSASHR